MKDASEITSASDAAHAFFSALQAHDVDRMLSLCSGDAQLQHVPMRGFETGNVHTVGRKAWSDMFSALPDLDIALKLIVADTFHVAAEAVITDRKRRFELPQAYFLTVAEAYRITDVTVYWDNITLGIEGTKAGAIRLVEAIAQLGQR